HIVPRFSLHLCDATATTEIYTLSLHDALPIYALVEEMMKNKIDAQRAISELHTATAEDTNADPRVIEYQNLAFLMQQLAARYVEDRKSTRLNSSHVKISYAVFCLKKKKNYKVK